MGALMGRRGHGLTIPDLEGALRRSDGNIAQAARNLGVSEAYVRLLMKKHKEARPIK
jgi:transcriptional regulator with GAF, ATPase, and Fis domain